MLRVLLVAFVSCAIPAVGHANILYTLVDYSGFKAGWSFDGGTVTTDGTIGTLTSSNFVDWDISFTTSTGSYTFNTGNSSVGVSSPALATLTGDASGITQTQSTTNIGGQLLSFSNVQQSIQWQAGGTIISPALILNDLSAADGPSSVALLSPPNNVATSAVPEPSTSLVLAAGLLALAGRRRRLRRVAAESA